MVCIRHWIRGIFWVFYNLLNPTIYIGRLITIASLTNFNGWRCITWLLLASVVFPNVKDRYMQTTFNHNHVKIILSFCFFSFWRIRLMFPCRDGTISTFIWALPKQLIDRQVSDFSPSSSAIHADMNTYIITITF